MDGGKCGQVHGRASPQPTYRESYVSMGLIGSENFGRALLASAVASAAAGEGVVIAGAPKRCQVVFWQCVDYV